MIFVALVVCCAGAGIPVYVLPQIDPLRHADAIFVLGGQGVDRYGYGLELAKEGYASTVVFSNPYGVDTDIDEVRVPCHTPQHGFTLECFDPDPPTTKGEARELRRLATERGWKTVIVVTFKPHISRARYILEQCFGGSLIMAASHENLSLAYWAWAYTYQSAGYVRNLFDRAC